MSVHTMESAPKDGTKIQLLVRHRNHVYEPSEKWQQWCDGYWTEHNGGAWAWAGISGTPIAWKALQTNSAAAQGGDD